MAWLLIDPAALRLGLAPSYGAEIAWKELKNRHPDWVAELETLCGARSIETAAIDAVTVIGGQASFSDSRTAALVGNMLAWFNPQAVLYEAPAGTDPAAIVASSQRVDELKPHYFAEPNITKPKA